MIELKDENYAIELACTFNGSDSSNIAEAILEVSDELKRLNEDRRWFCIIGVCDICGWECVDFLPAVYYKDGIVGLECDECKNISIYPKEADYEA